MSDSWDARFDRADYLFGTAPAKFLLDHAGMIPQGASVLSVAEGEGRNAVWLAKARTARVTAFDGSGVALEKARKLAAEQGVTVDLQQADIAQWDWGAQQYDVVVACYIQFCPPALRAQVFDGMVQALKPGGRLMLTGYTPAQIAYGTGGPRDPALLYTEDLLRAAFQDLQILRLASYEATLDEGPGHNGRSALIDLIADRPHLG